MCGRVIPRKLEAGDEVRVLAVSRSLGGIMQYGGITEGDVAFAKGRLEGMGLRVSFGRHVMECNEHLTASIGGRLEDLHEAWADPKVKGILAVSGGVGAIQLLEGIDYGLIGGRPKILCGYSDVAYVGYAIYARTGVVTYYGPNFSTFMMRRGFEYIERQFRACLFEERPMRLEAANQWSDDNWAKEQEQRTFLPNEGFWGIQEGEAEGTTIGGNAFVLNMLQGSAYGPALEGAIVFLEGPSEGKATLMALDTALRGLGFQSQFEGVRGVVVGRYARDAGISRERLAAMVREISGLKGMPVAANVDFGHTTPIMTLPIGGRGRVRVGKEGVEIGVREH